MGWNSSKIRTEEMGTIPHLRVVTPEEEANLEKYAPSHLDINTKIKAAIKQHQEKVLSELTSNNQSVDITTWLIDLEQNQIFNPIKDLFEEDFENRVGDMVANDGRFDKSAVLNVLYKRTLLPTMFYFGVDMNDDGLVIGLTPSPIWDETKKIDDRNLADYVIPENMFNKIDSGLYTLTDTTITPSALRRKMISLGFQENHKIME